MADWRSLVGYIKQNYKVAEDRDDTLGLLFDVPGGRTQKVLISRSGDIGGSEWADISTAVGSIKQTDPMSILRRNMDLKCGAFGVMSDGTLVLFHRFPLRDLDASEFDVPLHLVVGYGDELEKELTGRDMY